MSRPSGPQWSFDAVKSENPRKRAPRQFRRRSYVKRRRYLAEVAVIASTGSPERTKAA
jgi:hypothetical protein